MKEFLKKITASPWFFMGVGIVEFIGTLMQPVIGIAVLFILLFVLYKVN
jgi:hypothetical protein